MLTAVWGGHQQYTVHSRCNYGGKPCLNLSMIAANNSIYLDSNSTLIFHHSDQHYYLDSEFSVSDKEFLALSSDPNISENASIFCSANGRLTFSNVSQLNIKGLNFVGCSIMIKQVDQFIVDDCTFNGENANGSALQLSQVMNTEIMGSSFSSFTAGTYQNSVRFLNEVDHPYSLVHVESHDARIGGAVVVTNSDNLVITNSHFVNNSAQLGGAVFVQFGSTVTIDNSTFFDNSATNCTDDRCNGGALFIDSGCSIIAQNSTFENNTSDFSGGAIALFMANFVDTQNTFIHNKARNFGGSIFAHFNSIISSDMSDFTHNEADFSGGAIYADYLSSVSVQNDDFHYNRATMTMCTTPGSSIGPAVHLDNACFDSEAGFGGGVLYARFGSIITVEDSTFTGNKAENDGGVIYATSNSSITVDGSSFNGNSARYSGGVLYAYYYSSIIVKNSNFSDNVAENVGGIFHIFYSSTLSVENSRFYKNRAGYIGGVLHVFYHSTVVINDSSFHHNNASYFGGVVYANYICNVIVYNSSLSSNRVNADGGAIFTYDNNTITLDGSRMDDNVAGGNGGAVYASHLSQITFTNGCTHSHNLARGGGGVIFTRDDSPFTDCGSSFLNNKAETDGGSINIIDGDIRLKESNFMGNSAKKFGGALNLKGTADQRATIESIIFNNNYAMNGAAISMYAEDSNNLNMSRNVFSSNYAMDTGGALYLAKGNNLLSVGDKFLNNSADGDGGVVYLQGRNTLTIQDGNFSSNGAGGDGGALFSQMKTQLKITGQECSFIGNLAQNGGAIRADYSTVELNTQTLLIASNTANESGGALFLSRSNLTSFCGTLGMTENQAKNGGAVYASDSDLQTSGSVEIRNNLASDRGGGIYLMHSKLEISERDAHIDVADNMADLTGGGLHSSNSIITINGTVHFTNNRAENGSGISMEGNDRLYGSSISSSVKDVLNFSSNWAAAHGGALYVNDNSNTKFCKSMATDECFFSSIFLNFHDNLAGVSGADIFGGFLHRCTPKFSDDESNMKGLGSLYNSSNIEANDTISSNPVQVCFCTNGVPDCSYTPDSLRVQTEKEFSIEIIAYDQVNHGVNATFDCSLKSSSGLRQDQMIQHVGTSCTKLSFNLEQITALGTENLLLSVRGPCRNTESSDRQVNISVTCSCPLGFQKTSSKMCKCTCNDIFRPYEIECDLETRSIIRNDNFWVKYIEHDDRNNESIGGYLIYPNCPFDYCHPREANITINFNDHNGSDAQCASDRMGILCGACRPGLSVSLGTSRCLSCPNHWPWLVVAIVLVFIVAGIALVILLLVLNMTVAVGTINAIIFYANIVAANRSVVFQTSEISFATVLISWLNFDIGFDACFYDGMDTYIKTWLQLAFPIYIIILVVIIIKLSSISDTFAHLIGKKDPVATLATLVLLSYTKFLQTIITAFSNAILVYPDNSRRYVWLPDATVRYITSRHAFLFIAAIFILLISLVYTLLLFSWQWFLCCPMKRVKWIRNQKLVTFMEMYLIPYTPKHRYWTGLLLFVRVSIYLVSAFNPSSDPRITLSSTIFIMSLLFLYIAMFGIKMYKHWLINATETFTYFNLIALSIFTWYTTDAGGNQRAVTNISVGIIFIQLLAILLYHILRYANQRLYARIEKSVIVVKLKKYLEKVKPKECVNEMRSKREELENGLQADELLEMVDRPQSGGDSKIDSQHVFSNIVSSTISMAEILTSDFTQEEDLTDLKPKELNQQANCGQ